MGLDINLYKFENFDDYRHIKVSYSDAEQALYDAFYAPLAVDKHNELSPDQKRELKGQLTELRSQYGVDEHRNPLDSTYTRIRKDSKIYPDHKFKIGDWFSSHTEDGLDPVLQSLVGQTLCDVILPESVHYYTPVKWKEAKERATSLLAEMKERVAEVGDYKVREVSYNDFKDITKEKICSEKKAMDAFLTQMKEDVSVTNGYLCDIGQIFPDGIKVHGLVEGAASFALEGDGDKPSMYIIYSEPDKDPYKWYLSAMEIVIETIEYVLAQEDPSKYILSWRV